jgi:2,4-dienoyl-CoA reductase-like NADH-dependent reductase (Old Yellow Enzyme family)
MPTPTLLAQPLTLPCGARLPNRILKSAMTEGLADAHDHATPRLERLYERWSRGGAGLLITGNVMVDRRHLERAGNVVIEDGSGIGALRAWARAGTVAGNGLWMQLSHPGRQSPKTVNKAPVSASDVQLRLAGQFARPRPLTGDEIKDIVARFGRAAAIAREAGFTGVQVHGAHGYLVSQFLSPALNLRRDEYGGPLENRARLLLEILAAVRAAVGADFPVSVKLNTSDFRRGGYRFQDCLRVVAMLKQAGVDLIELSGGSYEQPQLMGLAGDAKTYAPERPGDAGRQEGFFVPFAEEVRRPAAGTPLAVTGGLRARAHMEQAVTSGLVDMVGLARPFCADPDIAAKLLAGTAGVTARAEREIRLGPGRLSVASGSPLIRSLNMTGQMGWFYAQIENMAEGRPVEPVHGALRGLVRMVRQDRRNIRARAGASAPA